MRLFGVVVLGLIGMLSMFAALGCAFVTFATNDYRPIIASGFGFGLMALSCFGVLTWRQREGRVVYLVIGVMPTIIAMAELLRRSALGILSWLQL
jgi:hypothetical protein